MTTLLLQQSTQVSQLIQGDDDDDEPSPADTDEPGGVASVTHTPRDVYKNEFERLKSFPIEWKINISKRELSDKGFYYSRSKTGTKAAEHKIKCAFCTKVIYISTLKSTSQLVHSNCSFTHHDSTSGNIPLRNITNFRYEKNRLITFLVTDWTAPVGPYDLAKHGFFYTGVSDVTRCEFCRLEVKGWEEGDTAEGEHIRWNPHCVFMNKRIVGNVPLGQESKEESLIPCCPQNSVIENLHYKGRPNFEDLNVTLTSKIRDPEYCSYEARLNSYSLWPMSMKQRPEHLSEAGFYYTGSGDRTLCFHCGGGLKDWSDTDDPWIEHAVWFPTCPYLLVKKGQKFVKSARTVKHNIENAMETPEENEIQPSHIVDRRLVENRFTLLEEKPPAISYNELPPEVDVTRLCLKCKKKELGIVFLPCGHMATCVECAIYVAKCPSCSENVNAYVRAFLP